MPIEQGRPYSRPSPRRVTRARVATVRPSTTPDLVALIVLAVVLPMIVAFPLPLVSGLQVPLGLIMTLFAPGYALTVALLPRPEDLQGVTRAALSIGLSVALIPVFAFLLDALPWGIRVWPIVSLLALWIVTLSAVAAWRRGDVLQSGYRVIGRLGRPQPLLALLVAAVVAVSFAVFMPARSAWQGSEFYALGANGLAENYPREATTTDEVTITIGVVNGGVTPEHYRIEVWVVDRPPTHRRELMTKVGPTRVPSGERHEQRLSWTMPWAGHDQRIELLLFAGEAQEPIRKLELRLDVESGVSQRDRHAAPAERSRSAGSERMA